MIYTLIMKTPDAVEHMLDGIPEYLDGEDFNEEYSKLKKLAEKYVSYGEYCYIEFDTTKNTAQIREL